MSYRRKCENLLFDPCDLDLWPRPLKFNRPVIWCKRIVSWKNGVDMLKTHCVRASWKCPHTLHRQTQQTNRLVEIPEEFASNKHIRLLPDYWQENNKTYHTYKLTQTHTYKIHCKIIWTKSYTYNHTGFYRIRRVTNVKRKY